MQAPKRKKSKSCRNMRRAHDFLTPVRGTTCAVCKEPVLPHHVCRNCGNYRGRKLLKASAAA